MGYWWEDVDHFPDDSGVGLTIKGNTKAWSKKSAPLLWRIQHQFAIVSVKTVLPYSLYFSDGTRQMVFKEPIKERWFATRVGRDDLRLVAIQESEVDTPLELTLASLELWWYWELQTLREAHTILKAFGCPFIGKFKVV